MYEQLLEKKKNGQIRHLGFSFHDTPALLRKVVDTYDFDFGQIQLNYMDYTIQDAKTQYEILCQKNLPIIVMEPNRGGALSTLNQEACDILARGGSGRSPTSYAMRWVMSFPQVMCVLSGMVNMEHTTDNIHTAEAFTPIIAKEQKLIDEALKTFQSSGTVPCTGCRYCIDCPKQINIPEIFAVYNQYQLRGSAETYEIGRSKEKDFLIRNNSTAKIERVTLCINCQYCSNHCPQHIDIPKMLQAIHIEDRELRNTLRASSLTVRLRGKGINLVVKQDCYKNFDIKNIYFPKDIFKFRSNPEGILEFFRQGRHTLGAPKPKEVRWLRIPITFPLQKQKKYVLAYNVKSTFPMKRVLFIEVAGQTQVFNFQINEDEWTNGNIEFTSNLNGSANLVITATDLPICGNTLFIKQLSIIELVN